MSVFIFLESPPHPVTLSDEKLLRQCQVSRLRRSGPGGQHRNKVETAVSLHHLHTGIRAEASERRSQFQNLSTALMRLRITLAMEVRCPIQEDYLCLNDIMLHRDHHNSISPSIPIHDVKNTPKTEVSDRISSSENISPNSFSAPEKVLHISESFSHAWHRHCCSGRITLSEKNADFPVILAGVLDLLYVIDYNHIMAASLLKCTVTQLLNLLRLEPRAMALLNSARSLHGLKQLR